jgi:hypothetical protein
MDTHGSVLTKLGSGRMSGLGRSIVVGRMPTLVVVALMAVVASSDRSAAADSSSSGPTIPTATPVDQTCGHVYAWPTPPDTYQQATIKAATFSYPWSQRDSKIEFLVLTSSTDTTFGTSTFSIDNPPGEYWSPEPQYWHPKPQSLTSQPNFEFYSDTPKKEIVSFDPDTRKKKIFYSTGQAPIAALALVPIYVQSGIQYCMTTQLTQAYSDYIKQSPDKRTYVSNFSTTASSPIFATIVVEFLK